MKTTLSEREGNTVKLEVEVSSEELQEAFDKRLRELTKEVRVPGFRPGKVPAAMLRQRIGDEAIITDTVESAMNDWFAAAVAETGIDPVDRPQIDVGEDLPELGKPLSFTATVTIMPEVELGEYKGLEVPKEPAEVLDEEVDGQFERLRNEFAELRPVEGRPVRRGDFVTADFSAALEGEPVESLAAADFVFEAGAGRLFPEIEVQTLGMNVDEEKTFKLKLPAEAAEAEVGGKEVDFTVKVKDIKEKVLPPVTDKWASEVSEFATLLELRQEIRSKIQGAKTYQSEQRFRSLAVQAAADNAKLDLPDVIVTEQAQEMALDFTKSLAAQGGDVRQYLQAAGIGAEQMIEDMKPQAARNVKTGLVLDAVAQAEGLEVTDEDITAAIRQMATAARTDAAALEDNLRKTDRLDPIKWQVLREKAADFIAEQAIAVAPPEPQEAAEEEEAEEAAEPSPEAPEESAEPLPEAAEESAEPAAEEAEEAEAAEDTETAAAPAGDAELEAEAEN